MREKKPIKLEELGRTVMPIVGFWGPPDEAEFKGKIYKSLKTDEVFSLVKEVGINLFLQGNDPYPEKKESVEKTLELCEKYNLYYYVSAPTLCEFKSFHNIDGETRMMSVEEMAEEIEPFIHHPNCAGLMVIDEPLPAALPELGEFLTRYKTALKTLGEEEKRYFVNLLPVCRFVGEPTIECWKNYVRRALTEGKLDYISYDFYPCQLRSGISKDNISPGIYNHNEALLEVAERFGNVPFGVCVQTGGNWTEESDNPVSRRPSPEEVEWMVNVHLAFGAKMITYFTLCNPVSFFKYLPQGATGILTPEGRPSDMYYAVKRANRQIEAVDEYLLKAKSRQVIALGDVPSRFEYYYRDHINENDSSYMELVHAEGDGVLIGCFTYDRRSAFYVVNTFKKAQKVHLTFNGMKEMTLVRGYDGSRKTKASELELSLAKSEATLIIIDKWL